MDWNVQLCWAQLFDLRDRSYWCERLEKLYKGLKRKRSRWLYISFLGHSQLNDWRRKISALEVCDILWKTKFSWFQGLISSFYNCDTIVEKRFASLAYLQQCSCSSLVPFKSCSQIKTTLCDKSWSRILVCLREWFMIIKFNSSMIIIWCNYDIYLIILFYILFIHIHFMDSKNERLTYNYLVYPGNNPNAIESALKKRNCWFPLPQDKYPLQAHLLWKNLNFPPKFYTEGE